MLHAFARFDTSDGGVLWEARQGYDGDGKRESNEKFLMRSIESLANAVVKTFGEDESN